MNKTFGLFFYMKRSKMTSEGIAPVYLRITVDGERVEIASKRYVKSDEWSQTAQKLLGNSTETRNINHFLKTLEQKVYETYREMIEQKASLTATSIKLWLNGQQAKEDIKYLIPIFKEHNRQIASLIGKEYAKGTVERYNTSLKHTLEFMQWKYKISDIDIRMINHEFITAYEFYLRSERNCNNNSAIKYIKNFGKIVRICLANGWINADPFQNYKAKVKKVDRPFLSGEELERITSKKFGNERLEQVRDIFLFSCYTGLAYIDVQKLKRADISTGVDGEDWIFIKRQKTDTPSSIPLLPAALTILESYTDHPQCLNSGKILPVSSNQKVNAYLKEIAAVCRINKPLTFHVARHTFATTVTLLNGVPIESVSKMLGHTNIKTTQHYARILDIKIGEDMGLLRKKLAGR